MESSSPTMLADLRRRIGAVDVPGRPRLPVPEGLAPVVPQGGLPVGWTVGISGIGARTVATLLIAALIDRRGWAAFVGVDDLGLVAAAEAGLALDRVLSIEHPEPDRWADVVAIALEATTVVCVRPTHRVAPAEARRLGVRLREEGAVLIHLDGGSTWPLPLDLSLRATAGPWQGLGSGHGHLRSREVLIEADGRRFPSARTSLVCPAGSGWSPMGS